jgi:RHH-type proline utilization regulon transcriptional repressor/proline dehydrogenase/delta 1-pyrroline-5-carboxylate dehydrogenase
VPPGTEHGTFFAPQAWEINGASIFAGEVFGPILHVVRWRADRLDRVLDEIAATGYGLTLGIHSRIDETVRHIVARLAAAPATTAPAAMNGKASRPGPQRQP